MPFGDEVCGKGGKVITKFTENPRCPKCGNWACDLLNYDPDYDVLWVSCSWCKAEWAMRPEDYKPKRKAKR